MGRIDLIAGDWHAALAALDWQVDLGVDAAVLDAPLNRYEAVAETAASHPAAAAAAQPVPAQAADPVQEAVAAAGRATDLKQLRMALADYPHCDLARGARNMVFAGGQPGARVMIVGDAPDIDDDRQGKPFAGAKGALLDAMFAAIGLAREGGVAAQGLYLTTALPWKTPGNRTPHEAELAMIRPFLLRHIELAQPQIILAMGTDANVALMHPALPLARGGWGRVLDRPVLAMQHPAALLRNPAQKREAWADLLKVKARLAAQQGD